MFPDQKARDPGTSPNELLFLAPFYPEDVLANPVLPLVALENPALWQEIMSLTDQVHEERRQQTQNALQRQGMTLRLLLEMGAWLLGILFAIIILGSRYDPGPQRPVVRDVR